jgi:hypothetical protein
MTNSRVITLLVIADTRVDLPHARKPPSRESGNKKFSISDPGNGPRGRLARVPRAEFGSLCCCNLELTIRVWQDLLVVKLRKSRR